VTTVTTVGYGTPSPSKTESEIIAMIVMVVGIGFFAALAGSLANQFIEGREREIADAEQAILTADEHLLARVEAIAEQLDEVRTALRTRAGSE
jgi:voltage-gated potassium channel Kch